MKKLISSLLAAAVALSTTVCATSAVAGAAESADGAKFAMSVSFDKDTLVPGDEVLASLTLDKNPGIIGLRINVGYDDSVLSIANRDGIANAELLEGFVTPPPGQLANPFSLVWSDPLAEVNNESVGTVAEITFKVKDDAKLGDVKDALTLSFVDIAYISDPATLKVEKYSPDEAYADTSKAAAKIECKTHEFGEWDTVKSADCENAGTQKRTCKNCGAEETQEIKALGHDWGEWETVKEADCVTAGSQKRTCKRCDAEETQEIKALGHDYGEWETVKEADCVTAGSQKRICKRCDAEDTQEIAALGHDWGVWTVIKEATESEEGTEQRVCARCNETETKTIPVLTPDDNNSDNSNTSGTGNVSDPTSKPSNTDKPTDTDKTNPETGSAPAVGAAVLMFGAVGAMAISAVIRKRK